MKYKIGDWVKAYSGGRETVGRIASFNEEDPAYCYLEGDDTEYKTLCHLEQLEVAGAFAIAGFPVPEGARIWKASHSGQWQYQPSPRQPVVEFNGTGWEIAMTISGDTIDLYRTPASDCIDGLPAVIREAIEGKVK